MYRSRVESVFLGVLFKGSCFLGRRVSRAVFDCRGPNGLVQAGRAPGFMHKTVRFDPGTAENKGPGAFPSSRLDSHRNFEPLWLGYIDFRQFPTRFVQILMFSSPNALSARAKFALGDKQPPSWGSFNRFYRREQNLLSEIIVTPSWRSFDRFYR